METSPLFNRILEHKASLDRHKKIEITPFICSDPYRLKLDINNNRNTRELTTHGNKTSTTEWKWIKTEIEKDVKDYLEFNGTKRIHKTSNVIGQNIDCSNR